jgi:hypothetical protein
MTKIIFAFLLMASTAMATGKIEVKVKSTAVGVHFTLNFPKDFIQSRIPQGLTLDPKLFRPDGTYPVQVFFGGQMRYRAGLSIGGGLQIEGLFSGDVFTVRTIGVDSKPYDFVLQADVGNEKIHEFEKFFLGWDKNMVFADWDNTDYTAGELDLTRLYRGEFESLKSYDKNAFRAHLRFFRDESKTPIILAKNNGKFACFNQEWMWGELDNRYRPINAKIMISKAAFGGVMEGTHMVPSFDKTPYGALKLVMQWKMRDSHECNPVPAK